MRSDDKTHINIFLVILNFVLVVLVTCTLSCPTYGQLKTLYELAKHAPNQNATIAVGASPSAIGVDEITHKVYVVNAGDGTVSVINALYSTKTGTIKVGKVPSAIAEVPKAIGVDDSRGKVYVTNRKDGTVSVINSTSNANTSTAIKVGKEPIAISIDSLAGKAYVANRGDNTVSVIDEATDKVVAAVTFSVKPFNAGHIECDKNRLIAPVAQQFYIWSGSECTAKPNQGFDFVGRRTWVVIQVE